MQSMQKLDFISQVNKHSYSRMSYRCKYIFIVVCVLISTSAVLAGCGSNNMTESCSFTVNDKGVTLIGTQCNSFEDQASGISVRVKEKENAYQLKIFKSSQEIKSELFNELYIDFQVIKQDDRYFILLCNGGETYDKCLLVIDNDGKILLEVKDTNYINIGDDILTVWDHAFRRVMWGACGSYPDIDMDMVAYSVKTFDIRTMTLLSSVDVPISELCIHE